MLRTWSLYTGLAVLITQLAACGGSDARKVAAHAGAGGDGADDLGGSSGDTGAAPGGGIGGRGGAGGGIPRGGTGGAGEGGASTAGTAGDASVAGSTSGGGQAGAPEQGGGGGSAGTGGSSGSGVLAPSVAAFAGPVSACAGTDVDLTYSYSGGSGVITPGSVAAAQGAGHATVTLGAQDTTYTLTVTGSGGAPATATAKVLSVAAPSATITVQPTVAHGNKSVAASVSAQAQVTYAWSVLSGNATINGSATGNQVAFDVGATGTEVVLQVAVTSSSASACASTATVHIPIRCGVPVLASIDHSKAPAVTQYVPNNMDTGAFDMTSSANIWTAYFTAKAATASYDTSFDHFSAGTWNGPVKATSPLNDPTAHVLYSKVATDNAGDAVFVWTQTTDNSNYSVMVSAYRVSDSSWSAPQQVGTVFNQQCPVQVRINRTTGTALIAWVQGTFTTQIPHLRSYTVSSNTLGADTPLRATTTNKYTGDQTALDFATNDALTGFVAWFEEDSGTSLTSLYALHVTAGVPDTAGTAFDIKPLAVGTSTFMTDIMNQYSAYSVSSDREPHLLAVSAAGNGAVVWGVFNGASTGVNHGQLYVRRYTVSGGGAWGSSELVGSQVPSYSVSDLAIDDAGNVIAEVWTNNVGYDFFNATLAGAWSAPKRLANVTGYTALPHVALDSSTGKGIATFRDPSAGTVAALRGVFYDPTAHSLSAAFTIDDPQQSGGESGHVRIDSTGLATVLFTQMPTVPPAGSNSSNSSLLFSTTCN